MSSVEQAVGYNWWYRNRVNRGYTIIVVNEWVYRGGVAVGYNCGEE